MASMTHYLRMTNLTRLPMTNMTHLLMTSPTREGMMNRTTATLDTSGKQSRLAGPTTPTTSAATGVRFPPSYTSTKPIPNTFKTATPTTAPTTPTTSSTRTEDEKAATSSHLEKSVVESGVATRSFIDISPAFSCAHGQVGSSVRRPHVHHYPHT
jgi:hypothetical protein